MKNAETLRDSLTLAGESKSLTPRTYRSTRKSSKSSRTVFPFAALLLMLLGSFGVQPAQADLLQFLSSIDIPLRASGGISSPVGIFGDLILVPVGREGVAFIDISDPSQPEQLFNLDEQTLGSQGGASVTDGSRLFAYLPSTNNIAAVDLTTTPPTVLGRFGSMNFNFSVHLLGKYLLAFGADTTQDLGGIFIYDITSPVPTLADIYSIPIPSIQEHIWVSDDGLVFVKRGIRFDIIDMSDPLSAKVVGSWTPSGASPQAVTSISRRGDRVATGQLFDHVTMLDISDLSNIQTVAPLDLQGLTFVIQDVEVVDDSQVLVMSDSNGPAETLYLMSYSEGSSVATILDSKPLGRTPQQVRRMGTLVMTDELVGEVGQAIDRRRLQFFRLTSEIFVDGFESGDLTAWGS